MSRQNCFFPGCDNLTEDDSTLCKYHLSGGTNTSNTLKTDDGVVSDELEQWWENLEQHFKNMFVGNISPTDRVHILHLLVIKNDLNALITKQTTAAEKRGRIDELKHLPYTKHFTQWGGKQGNCVTQEDVGERLAQLQKGDKTKGGEIV